MGRYNWNGQHNWKSNIQNIFYNIFDLFDLKNILFHKVNDLRRSKHEFEPMEWTPDSIVDSDIINCCLVIDTNILLSDLKSITVVINTYLTGKLFSNKMLFFLYIIYFKIYFIQTLVTQQLYYHGKF